MINVTAQNTAVIISDLIKNESQLLGHFILYFADHFTQQLLDFLTASVKYRTTLIIDLFLHDVLHASVASWPYTGEQATGVLLWRMIYRLHPNMPCM